MTLAAAAARDEITGIIFAASLDKPDRFISNIVGECADRPTYALGLVSMLTDQLKGLQHDMRDNGEA
ncbi:hypothetical protein [Variovorax sp. dw_308]|uniref:hypothetical protein n=1 Tax=Variovorax sp. dw_308 TaxID=2721546 RepID=UPI001C456B98|nr:hypothetical protein [Variovorax sp. dw_308]